MTPPLTQVPATLPGVVRRGTPVAVLDSPDAGVWLHGLRLTVDRVEGRFAWFSVLGSESGLPLSWLSVDLTDETGRAHARLAVLSTIPGLRVDCGVLQRLSWRGHLEMHAWRADGSRRQEVHWLRWSGTPSDDHEHGDWYRHCPSLADLDPNDPTLLPDGSRWVDAEALARVLLHVLGGAS